MAHIVDSVVKTCLQFGYDYGPGSREHLGLRSDQPGPTNPGDRIAQRWAEAREVSECPTFFWLGHFYDRSGGLR
jgi:hypothetical protein